MSRLSTIRVAFDVKRRSPTLFPVLPKPEVVLTVKHRVRLCGFRHISTLGLARNGYRWPIFARSVRITLRIDTSRLAQSATGRQSTTGIGLLLPVQRELNIFDVAGHREYFSAVQRLSGC